MGRFCASTRNSPIHCEIQRIRLNQVNSETSGELNGTGTPAARWPPARNPG
jgi:hypothetical protein